MCSYLPAVVDASQAAEFPVTGTPAGAVAVRALACRFRGDGHRGDAVPAAGELAVFCRPVVTAPAVVRRDGTVLADAWLPDLVRLGELERHLGDGVIEAAVGEAIAAGRLKPRQRRRIMSYPLVIRLMSRWPWCRTRRTARPCPPCRAAGGHPVHPGMARPDRESRHGLAAAGPRGRDGRHLLARGRAADRRRGAVGGHAGGHAVLAADGMLVNLADTPANRAMFGSTGTADDSEPFPQLRVVALTARAGRA